MNESKVLIISCWCWLFCTVTVPAVGGQLEARGAAALVGAQDVVTLVRTQMAGIVPAFIEV